MRTLLFACAAGLLLSGFSGCAAHNLRTGECSVCQASQCGGCGKCGGQGCPRRVFNPAPGAYRHAGHGFDDAYCAGGHCGHGMGGGLGAHGAHPWQDGAPSGPPTAHVGYPYYTLRGPRDFLLNNPPTIGP